MKLCNGMQRFKLIAHHRPSRSPPLLKAVVVNNLKNNALALKRQLTLGDAVLEK